MKGEMGINTVIRTGRFFDEPRFEFSELFHILDRLRDAPDLIRINHENVPLVETDDLPRDAKTLFILRNVPADFEFEVSVPFREGFFQEPAHFVFAVAEPAS
jgi:hypothetical protein